MFNSLLGYFWLIYYKCGIEPRQDGTSVLNRDWSAVVCQAAAITLLVGFWFDGGLFKLPTSTSFWILLELGKLNRSEMHGQKND